MRAIQDRYGFLFWLKWIIGFAGSFIAAAVFWTILIQKCFGTVQGPELTLTWLVSVFGGWFILVTPFMRKKEQIWKRLNQDQERAVDAWFLGLSVFIGLLSISAFVWSLVFKTRLHLSGGYGLDSVWAKAVFGSWLVILIPFLVLMYRKADTIFKDAVERQTYVPKFRSLWVEESYRLLPASVASKILSFPPTLPGGHVVTAVLKDGRKVPHLFVRNGREISGIYDQKDYDFVASEIQDVERMAPEQLPAYDEAKWLRLDYKALSS